MNLQEENEALKRELQTLRKQLDDSTNRFDILSQTNFEPIVVTSNGIILEVNRAAEEDIGYSKKELLGSFIGDMCTPESLRDVMASVTSDAELTYYELIVIRKDGSHYPAEVRSRKIMFKGQQARIACVSDITERKEVEKKQIELTNRLKANVKRLEESQKRLETLSKLSTEGIVIHKNNYIVDANEAYLKMTGYELSEIVDQYGKMLTPDETWYKLVNINENRLNKRVEVPLFRKDRSIFYAEVSGEILEFPGEKYTVVMVTDLTERRNAEEKRVKAVIKGIDNERRRIAQELHDGMGQTLIAVSMQLDYLVNNSNLHNGDLRMIAESLDLINEAINEGRQISHDLMPKSLADFGLKVSLEDFVTKVKKKTNTEIHLLIPDNLPDFKNEIQISIFRIIQESIKNAIKHANAQKLSVQIMVHKENIFVSIEDNGKGFDTKIMRDNDGLGLVNIKSRAFSIGANIEINSTVGMGTDIMVEIPFTMNENGKNS